MSRVIEFRVWNGYAMVYPTIGGGEGCDKPLDLNAELAALHRAGLVFLQFTGLLDKNGAQIFEGDIVAPDYEATSPVFEIRWGGMWEIAGFGLHGERKRCRFHSDTNFSWDALHPGFAQRLTVIGNIYENPELMEPVR